MATVIDPGEAVHNEQQSLPSVNNIQHILQQREAVLERLQQEVELLLEAEQIASNGVLRFPCVGLSKSHESATIESITGGYRASDLDRILR